MLPGADRKPVDKEIIYDLRSCNFGVSKRDSLLARSFGRIVPVERLLEIYNLILLVTKGNVLRTRVNIRRDGNIFDAGNPVK